MKPAECVRRILLFEKPEYIPNWDNGPMSRRVEAEWHKQGLPRDTTIAQYFGMVEPTYWYGWVGRGKFEPIPGVLDQGILEDHGGGHVITRD